MSSRTTRRRWRLRSRWRTRGWNARLAVGAAATTVSRRQNAVARERAAAEAVRLHAEAQALQATRRASRLERVADARAFAGEEKRPLFVAFAVARVETAVALGKASAPFSAKPPSAISALARRSRRERRAGVRRRRGRRRAEAGRARRSASRARRRERGEGEAKRRGPNDPRRAAGGRRRFHRAPRRQAVFCRRRRRRRHQRREGGIICKEREPSGAAGVAQGPATQFPLLRDRSAKAFALRCWRPAWRSSPARSRGARWGARSRRRSGVGRRRRRRKRRNEATAVRKTNQTRVSRLRALALAPRGPPRRRALRRAPSDRRAPTLPRRSPRRGGRGDRRASRARCGRRATTCAG